MRSAVAEMAESKLRSEARSLLAHVLDEFGALNAIRPTGEVLDKRGDGELAAGLMTFQNHGFQVGAGGGNRSGKAGASRAENDGIVNSFCHVF